MKWARVRGCGGPALSLAAGAVGGHSRGGWPAPVARGVWCQALSLPWPPILWGGKPGSRDPCVPGVVGVGVGTQHRSHSVLPCGPALRAVGAAGGRLPGGSACRRCGGRLRSGAPPPPAACPPGGLSGSATHVLWARVCGCGGPALSPWLACPVGAACRGGGGGPSPGGWPATVVRGVWCQALSLPRPPVLRGGQPGFRDPCVPGAVGAGVGTQQRPHSARALAGRRCSLWGWRKGVPGGVAFHRCEGRLRSGAPPPPTARPRGGLWGSATHVLWARVCGCGGPALSSWLTCPVGDACRGGGGGLSPGGVACHCYEARLVSGAVPPPAARDADSQRIQFEFAEFAANSFAARIRCEFGLKFLVLQIRGEFALRIRRRRQNDHACAVFSPDGKLTLNCAMQ